MAQQVFWRISSISRTRPRGLQGRKSLLAHLDYLVAEKVQDDFCTPGQVITADYRSKRKDLVATGFVLPDHLNEEGKTKFRTLEAYSRSLEKKERQPDALMGREVRINFNCLKLKNQEKTYQDAKDVTAKIAKWAAAQGMFVVYAIHDPIFRSSKKSLVDYNHLQGEKGYNLHAHIYFSARPISKDGEWLNKASSKPFLLNGERVYTGKKEKNGKRSYAHKVINHTDWGTRTWRKSFTAEAKKLFDEKILSNGGKIDDLTDFRSTKEINEERKKKGLLPLLRQKHLGAAAWSLEKSGIRTAAGNFNREVSLINDLAKKHDQELEKEAEQEKAKQAELIKKLQEQRQQEMLRLEHQRQQEILRREQEQQRLRRIQEDKKNAERLRQEQVTEDYKTFQHIRDSRSDRTASISTKISGLIKDVETLRSIKSSIGRKEYDQLLKLRTLKTSIFTTI